MKILGISDHHNASVALVVDGNLVAAVQEERFTRQKNFWGFPDNSIQELLAFCDVKWDEIDRVVFAGKNHFGHAQNYSRLKHLSDLKKIVQQDLIDALRGRYREEKYPLIKLMKEKIATGHIPSLLFGGKRNNEEIQRKNRAAILHKKYPKSQKIPFVFLDHHNCHFGSAFYGSGFLGQKALVFTNDNQGDGFCARVTMVEENGNRIVLDQIRDQNSIGMIWAIVTLLTGFIPLEHEYKLMGMAPYANEKEAEKISEEFMDLFVFEGEKFSFRDSSIKNETHMQPLIEKVKKIMQFRRFDNLCGGIQLFTEKILCKWIRIWILKTGIRKIALAGGVFMNVKANQKIMEMPCVEKIFVYPSCGDETNSIGAAYYMAYQMEGKCVPLRSFYLGKSFSENEIQNFVKKSPFHPKILSKPEETVAQLLANGEIVARFDGREEFGARALGNRSILADPRDWKNVEIINNLVKQRDFWMPFACAILEEDAENYLEGLGKNDPYYMIMTFQGGKKIQSLVAGIHPRDKTIRPQLVSMQSNPGFYKIIRAFKELTGVGAILNTSFNLHGSPLVSSPEDALDVFQKTGLKHLVLGQILLSKK